jgi:hypothetical protein
MSGVRGERATYKCARCGDPFTARTADRKRGWARFCSKSCKAIRQTQVTGRGAPTERLSNWDRYAETVHPFSPEAFEQ